MTNINMIDPTREPDEHARKHVKGAVSLPLAGRVSDLLFIMKGGLRGWCGMGLLLARAPWNRRTV